MNYLIFGRIIVSYAAKQRSLYAVVIKMSAVSVYRNTIGIIAIKVKT